MAKIEWDKSGEHLYETGVSKGVLYVVDNNGAYSNGVAWNGLSSVSESPSGAEASPIYADNIKYLNLYSAEEFAASVEAYIYPDEFAQCDGSDEAQDGVFVGQQARKSFGLCYRTEIGNELTNEYGYKLHLIYGCKAAPSERQYSTINDSPEAITMSWELSTTPVNVTGKKPTSTITIDSTKCLPADLAALEAILYGCDEFDQTKTYAVGAVVSHDTKTYKCTTAVTTAGAWNATNWTEISSIVGPQMPLPDAVIAMFHSVP